MSVLVWPLDMICADICCRQQQRLDDRKVSHTSSAWPRILYWVSLRVLGLQALPVFTLVLLSPSLQVSLEFHEQGQQLCD